MQLFITAVTEEKKMPVLNKNDGQVYFAIIYRCSGVSEVPEQSFGYKIFYGSAGKR